MKQAKRKTKPDKSVPDVAAQLMEPAQIAAALRVSARELRRMVSAREYPGPDLYIGRLPRWRVSSHNRWVEERSDGQ